MLKAIIFDFDGIIAHTEPIHLKAFQTTLRQYEIALTEEEYYDKYLAYDDRTFFKEILKDRSFEHDEQIIADMMSTKSAHYEDFVSGNMELLPGAEGLIRSAADKYAIAIGSGALRGEIVDILRYAGIESYFKVIVSAEDVARSKPEPDVFIEALKRLNKDPLVSGTILAQDCLVIEDSVSGIKAALSAGMKCLAVTNSYPEDKLSGADLVKESLKDVRLSELESLF